MPNITISVPDDLKAEMDSLTEVNWSEVCRSAISKYIEQRKNPNPKLELEIRGTRLEDLSYDNGYPSLVVYLRIHNNMASDITVDRILCNARLVEMGNTYPLGSSDYLDRNPIKAHSVGGMDIRFPIPKEKMELYGDLFKSTFTATISCRLYVDGFDNQFYQELQTVIPIDSWRNTIAHGLNLKSRFQTDRAEVR